MGDFFDLVFGLAAGSFGPGSWPGVPDDPAERAAAAVGVLALPALAFCVVLFAGVVDPVLALVAIPLACVALATGLALALRTSSLAAVRIALGSAVASFLACGTGWLLAVVAAFFRAF